VIFKLTGALQHYDWGGHEFIPRLLGMDNTAGKPCAELWLGAHPSSPANIELGGQGMPLDRAIERDPESVLGPVVAHRFGRRLPYLLKVLDACKMLSIQAHPSKLQAQERFAQGNPNYKDDNHKPEVHVALTEFWMLHGFRPLHEIAAVIDAVPEFAPLQPFESVRALYETVMTIPQPQVDSMLGPLIQRLRREVPTDRDHPDFWALRAAGEYGNDRGIFSIYLLNLLHLQPGEGTYQAPGVLHAYLEGTNVELMASSDNVLRGGLTPKRVDVEELMRVLSFDCCVPELLLCEKIASCEIIYRTPAEEFLLSRLECVKDFAATADGPEVWLVIDGKARISAAGRSVPVSRGESALVQHGSTYVVSGRATLFRARVPL
jgi:mannose-6-phosphate isomerase